MPTLDLSADGLNFDPRRTAPTWMAVASDEANYATMQPSRIIIAQVQR
jgi:hypothetical protein